MRAAAIVRPVQHRGMATAAGGQPVPNKFTQYYSQMKSEACPEAIRAYATCVRKENEEGDLQQGACQKEFEAVKACFRRVQRQARENQR